MLYEARDLTSMALAPYLEAIDGPSTLYPTELG
jgi:hypothetical protein